MKLALHSCALFGFLALTGCQAPPSESLDVAAYRQANPIRIEFTRTARVYEEGDALFAMMNDTRQVLWFHGQGPDAPAYHLKTGNSVASQQKAPLVSRDTREPERFPLPPGDIRYFHIETGRAAGPISVGITFYTSRTGTNAIPIGSSPAMLSSKRQ
ncbi:MAG TPA: hypothetical protein VNT99_14245 [Methylomirabilota bacterium]|nr:hypothetical protein [Methylomirabilota bacterium]